MASAARPSANVAKAFASIPGSPFLCDGVFFANVAKAFASTSGSP